VRRAYFCGVPAVVAPVVAGVVLVDAVPVPVLAAAGVLDDEGVALEALPAGVAALEEADGVAPALPLADAALEADVSVPGVAVLALVAGAVVAAVSAGFGASIFDSVLAGAGASFLEQPTASAASTARRRDAFIVDPVWVSWECC
jgi:hypothetical protein